MHLCQGTTQPQSFQLAEPLWIDPGINSEISMRELISTQEKDEEEKMMVMMMMMMIMIMKMKKAQAGRTFSQNPRKRGKSHHHHFLKASN